MHSASSRDTNRRRLSIAVIGSGISAMSAAWLLARRHDVTIFEKQGRLGGHSNTAMVSEPDGPVAIDTGFIVYNEATYPNLKAMFTHLGVDTVPSDMSFAVSADSGRFEYSGTDINGLLAQRSNLLRPRFWSMTRDILRFYRDASRHLAEGLPDDMTLADYLRQHRYGRAFIRDHLLPMAAAIWSSPAADMQAYPIASFLGFFINHGLLLLRDRPQWRTVQGGSRRYLQRMLADANYGIKLGCGAVAVRTGAAGVEVRDDFNQVHRFDHVVLGCHADEALALLAKPTPDQRHLLGAFRYQTNRAVLHRDPALMPQRRAAWSSWNYLTRKGQDDTQDVCVTYWMNKLQPLATARDYFVTLNPVRAPRADLVEREVDYMHPVFDTAAGRAQSSLWSLQGRGNLWFCGSYFGYGFHEDGLQAGLAVAEQLGGVRRPWNVVEESGRITVTSAQPMIAEAAE